MQSASLSLLTARPPERPREEPRDSSDDFSRFLDQKNRPEFHATRPEPVPHHPGRHADGSDERHPEEKGEEQPEGLAQHATLGMNNEVLLPLLQQLDHSLPEVKELPTDLTEGLQMRVRRGALPEGPRETLLAKKAPESQKTEILPVEDPETAEAVVQVSEATVSEDEEKPEVPAKMAESLPVTEHTTAEKAAPTEMSEVRPAEVPEAPVKMPEGLNLEIRDGQGRWELGVVRENQTVHLEFHGDPELRRIVQESTREVGERMARHGDTLGSVSWRPIASSSSSSSEQQLGDNQHQQNTPQQNGQQSTQQHKNGDSPSETPQKSSSSSPKTNRRALRVI